jgi:hypothetical protein
MSKTLAKNTEARLNELLKALSAEAVDDPAVGRAALDAYHEYLGFLRFVESPEFAKLSENFQGGVAALVRRLLVPPGMPLFDKLQGTGPLTAASPVPIASVSSEDSPVKALLGFVDAAAKTPRPPVPAPAPAPAPAPNPAPSANANPAILDAQAQFGAAISVKASPMPALAPVEAPSALPDAPPAPPAPPPTAPKAKTPEEFPYDWECKQCGNRWPHGLPGSNCPKCDYGAARLVRRGAPAPAPAPQAYAPSSPTAPVRPPVAAPQPNSAASQELLRDLNEDLIRRDDSRVLPVRSNAICTCDNENCGSDDLVFGMPNPLNYPTLNVQYQCLGCGHRGAVPMDSAEILQARATAPLLLGYHVGITNWEEWKNAEAPAPAAPVPVDATVAESAPEKKRSRGRPKKGPASATKEGTPAIEQVTFPGSGPGAGAAEAGAAGVGRDRDAHAARVQFPEAAQNQIVLQEVVRQVAQELAPQAAPQVTPQEVAPYIQALVEKAVSFESPLVDPASLAGDLMAQMQDWDLLKLVKEYEALTNQRYTPGQTDPDSMREAVVNAIVGATVPLV